MGAFIRKNDRLWFSLKKKHIVLRNNYCDEIRDKGCFKVKIFKIKQFKFESIEGYYHQAAKI